MSSGLTGGYFEPGRVEEVHVVGDGVGRDAAWPAPQLAFLAVDRDGLREEHARRLDLVSLEQGRQLGEELLLGHADPGEAAALDEVLRLPGGRAGGQLGEHGVAADDLRLDLHLGVLLVMVLEDLAQHVLRRRGAALLDQESQRDRLRRCASRAASPRIRPLGATGGQPHRPQAGQRPDTRGDQPATRFLVMLMINLSSISSCARAVPPIPRRHPRPSRPSGGPSGVPTLPHAPTMICPGTLSRQRSKPFTQRAKDSFPGMTLEFANQIRTPLALNGGTPVVTHRLGSPWPLHDEAERLGLMEVLESGKWWRGGIRDPCRFEGRPVRGGLRPLPGREVRRRRHQRHDGARVRLQGRRRRGRATRSSSRPSPSSPRRRPCCRWGPCPVFVDVDPRTYTIDPAAVEAAITDRTRCIAPVDYGGMPSDYDRLIAIGKQHGIPIVSDCAHAHGSQWKGRGVGALTELGTFSFQQFKTLTTGEGGMVMSDDEQLIERAYSYHHIGRIKGRPFYEHHVRRRTCA